MKNTITEFNYPIIIKYIHGFLTVSVPDLGISTKISMTADFYQTTELAQNQDLIWQAVSEVIKESVTHLETKKWIPDASQIKTQLKAPEKDYSLPEFCRVIEKHVTLSENTLRREIARGKIICYTTSGGHRRIPESEVLRYIASLKTQDTNAIESDHL